MEIGASVNDYLKRHGISKTFLAKEIGVTRQSVHRLCKDETKMTILTLEKIARALNVDINVFLTKEEEATDNHFIN